MHSYATPPAPTRLLLLLLGVAFLSAGFLFRSFRPGSELSVADLSLAFVILGGSALLAATAFRPLQVAGLTVSGFGVGVALLLAVASFTRSPAETQLTIATARFRSEEALLRLRIADPTYLPGSRPRTPAAIHAELQALGHEQAESLTRLRAAAAEERRAAVVFRILFFAALFGFGIQFHYRARHSRRSPAQAPDISPATPASGGHERA